MSSTVELARLPYAFALNRLLVPDKFISELRDRGVRLDHQRLEALHQLRLVVPLVRLRRDTRRIAGEYRRNPREAWALAHWQPTSRWDLDQALAEGRLFDPASERFMSRIELTRTLGDAKFEASVYLYSPQQLIYAPLIDESLPWLQLRGRNGRLTPKLTVHSIWRRAWVEQAIRLRELALAVLVLERLYYSQVLGTLRIDSDRRGDWDTEFDRYFAWRREQPLGRPLRWLGVNSKWILDAGLELLRLADRHDPLGDWAELLPYANPERWSRLKGNARSAVDLRVAAEVLLRYHDDLVEAGRAKPLPDPQPRFRSAMDFRLKTRRSLDGVLADFGLSPHPRVVVVVEGATERLLLPRVMEAFGIRTDEDFIAIQDAGGVGRDLAPLMAYLAPRLGERQTDRYIELVRNPTRVLVVLDAEGPVERREQREARRQVWVNRLMETLPRELRRDQAAVPVIREQLDLLVDVTTWNRAGESFEFAHFTNAQIARAIDRLDGRADKPGVQQLVARVESVRSSRGNLASLLHHTSKLDLADELWLQLEGRIDRVRAGADGRRIPIVRVLDRALELAHEFGRGRIVLALEPQPTGTPRRSRRRR